MPAGNGFRCRRSSWYRLASVFGTRSSLLGLVLVAAFLLPADAEAGRRRRINQPPNGVIDTPTGSVTIDEGESVDFTGTGSDPDGQLWGITFQWDFDEMNSGVVPSSQEDPGSVQFDIPGTFVVRFTVTDAQGLPDPTPAEVSVTVLPVVAPPALTSPVPGSILDGPGATFVWEDNGTSATEWWVTTGSSPGLYDGPDSGSLGGAVRSWAVYGLPSDGNPLYVTLWWRDGPGAWELALFQYTSSNATVRIDNEEAGFVTVGSWSLTNAEPGYYGPNYRLAQKGDGTETATWSFNVATAGEYAVHAQWPTATNYSRNAQFSLYHDATLIESVFVDQTRHGGQQNLLGAYSLTPGTLNVVLESSPNAKVAADSVSLSSAAFDFSNVRDGDVISNADLDLEVEALGIPPTWGVEFVVDGDTAGATQDYTAPFTRLLQGLTLAEHSVQASLVDGTGTPMFNRSVDFGAGDVYLALGDSITRGSHDDLPGDDISLDGRNVGGGFEPILNDDLTATLGYPQTVENYGVSGHTSLDGLDRILGVLDSNPQAQVILIAFGTNDVLFTPIPSGQGLIPGDPGYDGSFKDNLDQMANAALTAGVEPAFSHIPFLLGDHSGDPPFPDPSNAPENVLVREFNQAIDELVVELGLSTPTPGLYDHFEQFPGELDDDCHPNGIGYQSIAVLWRDALIP